MKTTTFVILLSLVQHSFYIKSNNRAHKRSPPKIAEKKTERAPPRRPWRPHLQYTLATIFRKENQNRDHLPEKI